jgi:uncharacterized protein with FMN-binding domain
MEPAKKINPAIAALIVIILIGVAVAAAIAANNNSADTDTTNTTPNNQSTPQEATPRQSSDNSTSSYKDGTYTAVGSYSTPGGRESIGLTVQVAGGIISSTSLEQNAKTGEAKEYQQKFASGYKELVVGKNINEVSLSRVAGSSLTSNGFNTALEQIKTDAAA